VNHAVMTALLTAHSSYARRIDVALLAVAFGDALHRAGLPVTPERSGRFAAAVGLLSPSSLDELYWAGRITLLTDHAQVDAFDRVFGQVFRGLVDPADTRGDPTAPPLTRSPDGDGPRARPGGAASAGAAQAGGAGTADTDARDVAVGTASREERLATTDFAELDPLELAALQQLMRRFRVEPPMRAGRRPQRHRHGTRIDLRATLQHSHRTGGDPVEQVRRRRRRRPRRLVVLLDISGSMEPYARAYAQFLHAAAAGSPGRAEVFAFATRLTRLTRALRVTDPQLALRRAATAAPDWKGGTRIGEALKAFLDGYGRRGVARGAVVVIVSDGWERDDPALLGEQMARLRRLAHRIVWINPRRADARYEPLTGGMAAALPHCDTVVSGHSVEALGEVVAAIAAG
jgi:uncharacterized protein with von Willebrand factor type A (vWA) domain